MLKVICPNCNQENVFSLHYNRPVECDHCFEQLQADLEIMGEEQQMDIVGLTMINQKTQQRIEVPVKDKVVLGREHHGGEIFSKITNNGKPVVSRKHFSIEFKDGCFYLLDEGSLNGTFYGVNKLSCKSIPHLVEDNSIIFVGEEAFMAQINFKPLLEEEVNKELTSEKVKTIKGYRCNDQNCSGYVSVNPFDICPICGAFKNSIPVY